MFSSWNSPAYPEIPDVAQPGLGTFGGRYISGKHVFCLIDPFIIPSFDEFGAALGTTQLTIDKFIAKSKTAGLQKVVIDLQQNTGGEVLLAVDRFKRFFPDIEPFAGSRLRAQDATNIMGQTLTTYFNQLSSTEPDSGILAADEWVATARLDAETGSNFTSWDDLFGPLSDGGHLFTKTVSKPQRRIRVCVLPCLTWFRQKQRFNLSSEVFVDNSLEDEGDFQVIPASADAAAPPWPPGDIILLTDGICGSSCALLVEMMHHEAGVRVVTVGGRPQTGPMQAASGSRGARVLSTSILDSNIDFVQELLGDSPEAGFLPNRTEALDVFFLDAGINLRDQVRRRETTPLQFAYEAADCRIFYTPQTVFNYTALWQYAADAIWGTQDLCVSGSTGYATTSKNVTDWTGPPSSRPSTFNIVDHITIANGSAVDDLGQLVGDLLGGRLTRTNQVFTNCDSFGGCPRFQTCVAIQRAVKALAVR
ncbi:Uu.00g033000.m01.CDS01 [Anthostomella pinea]|uniref:Uu.00g033000.m01.CDS01 n=1 Tax=Anthostomella pinea TaxID=933095 RepID=A0AAI8YD83_9PEZI|nr:Uu.00g033000.m01.CDS01 [Anthostomella pinea]